MNRETKLERTTEFLGEPVKNSFLLHAVKGCEDGRDMLYFSVSGTPSTFVAFDVNRKKAIRCIRQDSGDDGAETTTCWTHVTDQKGNVYMAPFGYPGLLYCYSAEDKQLRPLGSPFGEHALYHLSVDEADRVYGGTYPSGKIFCYDPQKKEFEDLGCAAEGEMYAQSCVYIDGKVYAGTRSQHPKMVCLDIASGRKETILPPDFLPFAEGEAICLYYYMTKIGKLLFPVVKTTKGRFYVLCYHTGENRWMKVCEPGLGGQHVSEPSGNKCYFVGEDGNLRAVELDTYEVSDTGICYLKFPEGDDAYDYANGFMGGGFYRLEDQTRYPGETLITVNYDNNCPVYINLQNKTVEFLMDVDLPKNPTPIHAMNTGRDGEIVLGTYMGIQALSFNPQTEEYAYRKVRQTEGICVCNGKLYFGVYTRAAIWEYDYQKPYVPDENPKPIFMVGYKQDRPFALCEAGTKLVIGTVPDYGVVGGALTVYDTETKEKKVYENLIEDQTITSLCFKDGLVYGTTGIWGGLGSVPKARQACVFVFDLEAGTVIRKKEVRFPGYDTPVMHLGGIRFDRSGKLWCISSGLIFTLDENTLEVQHLIDAGGLKWKLSQVTWRPYCMAFDEDGILYSNAGGKLTLVDTETYAVKQYDIPVQTLALGNDGNLYYSQGTKLYRAKKN